MMQWKALQDIPWAFCKWFHYCFCSRYEVIIINDNHNIVNTRFILTFIDLIINLVQMEHLWMEANWGRVIVYYLVMVTKLHLFLIKRKHKVLTYSFINSFWLLIILLDKVAYIFQECAEDRPQEEVKLIMNNFLSFVY